MPTIIWNKEEEEILKKYYLQPNGIEEIQKLTNKTRKQILTKGKYLGFRLVHFATKDDSFFEVPNIINSYVAGFLAGDGYMRYGQHGSIYLGLTLAQKDIAHLEIIKNLFKYNGKILFRSIKRSLKLKQGNLYFQFPEKTYYSAAIICTRAEKWREDIAKNWNFWKDPSALKKSLTLEPPINLINNNFKLSYLAGIIDADGAIMITSDKNHVFKESLKISIVGTEPLNLWIKELHDYYLSYMSTRQIESKPYTVAKTYHIGGIRAYWLSKIILSLKLPLLDRKWDNARHFIKRIESEPLSKQMITKLNNTFSDNLRNFFIEHNIEIPYFIK